MSTSQWLLLCNCTEHPRHSATLKLTPIPRLSPLVRNGSLEGHAPAPIARQALTTRRRCCFRSGRGAGGWSVRRLVHLQPRASSNLALVLACTAHGPHEALPAYG